MGPSKRLVSQHHSAKDVRRERVVLKVKAFLANLFVNEVGLIQKITLKTTCVGLTGKKSNVWRLPINVEQGP